MPNSDLIILILKSQSKHPFGLDGQSPFSLLCLLFVTFYWVIFLNCQDATNVWQVSVSVFEISKEVVLHEEWKQVIRMQADKGETLCIYSKDRTKSRKPISKILSATPGWPICNRPCALYSCEGQGTIALFTKQKRNKKVTCQYNKIIKKINNITAMRNRQMDKNRFLQLGKTCLGIWGKVKAINAECN